MYHCPPSYWFDTAKDNDNVRFLIDTLVALESDPDYTFDLDQRGNSVPMPVPKAGGIVVSGASNLMEHLNSLE